VRKVQGVSAVMQCCWGSLLRMAVSPKRPPLLRVVTTTLAWRLEGGCVHTSSVPAARSMPFNKHASNVCDMLAKSRVGECSANVPELSSTVLGACQKQASIVVWPVPCINWLLGGVTQMQWFAH
jgi:hypothetical protein